MLPPARQPDRTLSFLETTFAGHRTACASIWRSFVEGTTPTVRTASATLVEFASRRFVLTCDHVLAAYDSAVAEDARSTFRIGNLVIDLKSVGVARSQCADFAVLDVTNMPVHHIPDCPNLSLVFHAIATWPASAPSVGALTFFMGFPGSFRPPASSGIVDVRTFGLSDVPVVSSSEDHILLQFERGQWRDVRTVIDLDLGQTCGGLSGAGVYVRHANGPELVGLFQEHVPNFDAVRVTTLRSSEVKRCFNELGIRIAG